MKFLSRTVSKEGPNKGRPFYCCAKPRGQGCDFFEWGDTPASSAASNTFKTGRSAPANSGATKKRKCGLCHQEGRVFFNFVQRILSLLQKQCFIWELWTWLVTEEFLVTLTVVTSQRLGGNTLKCLNFVYLHIKAMKRRGVWANKSCCFSILFFSYLQVTPRGPAPWTDNIKLA